MTEDVLSYLENNSGSDKQEILDQGLSLVDVLEDDEEKKRVLKKIERDIPQTPDH